MAVFSGKEYEKASSDALAFIKRQLDVNNFKYQLTFAEEYADTYEGDIMWGYVTGLSSDEDQVFAKYISPTTYYDFSYKGKVIGNARNLTDYSDYAVNVYVIHDAAYKVITCPIKADGTWESVMTYRETYTVKDKDEEGNETGSTHTETVTYSVDISVGEGIKEFRLAKGLKGHWEQISSTTEMTAERYVYEADTEISAEDGGYGYSYFSYLFKKETGSNYVEFLNKIRLEEVLKELCVSDEKISFIAEAHGFHNQEYFWRYFKKNMGVSPAKWRQENR